MATEPLFKEALEARRSSKGQERAIRSCNLNAEIWLQETKEPSMWGKKECEDVDVVVTGSLPLEWAVACQRMSPAAQMPMFTSYFQNLYIYM